MIERKISLSYSDAKPTEVTDTFGGAMQQEKREYPEATPRSGKRLVFVDRENIDEVWEKIKKAVEDEKLGDSAKVSPSTPSPYAAEPKKHVIYVYAYDWTDEKDVKRIREELRKLGITHKMPYKTDGDIRKEKYRITGHTRARLHRYLPHHHLRLVRYLHRRRDRPRRRHRPRCLRVRHAWTTINSRPFGKCWSMGVWMEDLSGGSPDLDVTIGLGTPGWTGSTSKLSSRRAAGADLPYRSRQYLASKGAGPP